MRYIFLMLAIGLTLGTWLMAALNAVGADIPVPKSRPRVEECVHPGNKPAAGQQIQPDPSCPSGSRWKNPAR
jgi:hypothetical protein